MIRTREYVSPDVKDVITILCTFLHDTVDSSLTSNHFRSAVFNKNSKDVIDLFWNVLDKLTYYALKESSNNISIDYVEKLDDVYIRTKFRLIYLQYPSYEIYSLSGAEDNFITRSLLIALTWLIAKHDVLKNIIKIKLSNSSLEREFSEVVNDEKPYNDSNLSEHSLLKQLDNIILNSNRLSNNLKAISELQTEKLKLMSRVHAASIKASGLPHLSVMEMSIFKKLVHKTDNRSRNNGVEHDKIREMQEVASMLIMYVKWTQKSHVFFEWMTTVLDYSNRCIDVCKYEENLVELSRLIDFLRNFFKKLIELHISDRQPDPNGLYLPSKYLRVNNCVTKIQKYLSNTNNQIDRIDDKLHKKRLDLQMELKLLLNLMNDCIDLQMIYPLTT